MYQGLFRSINLLTTMVDSDKSDNVETQLTGKRSREDDSGDEKLELPSKRPCSKSPEPAETVESSKNIIAQVTNGSSIVVKEKTDAVDAENEKKNGEALDTNDKRIENINVEKLDENNDEKMIVEEENVKPVELEVINIVSYLKKLINNESNHKLFWKIFTIICN